MLYEVLYYDGWSPQPAYVLTGSIEGGTPEKALKDNLCRLIRELRDQFDLPRDVVSDRRIQDDLYVLRPDGLVSARDFSPDVRSEKCTC